MVKPIRRHIFILVVSMLSLAIFACAMPGIGGAAEAGEDVVADVSEEVEEAAAGEATEPGEEETIVAETGEGAAPVEWASMDELSSYRMEMQISDQAPDGSWSPPATTEMTVVNDPAQYSEHVLMSDAAGNTTEMITIGDTMWFNVGEGWMELPASGGSAAMGAPNAAASLPEGIETDMVLVGAEVVNGINCEHYTVDTTVSSGDIAGAMGDLATAMPTFDVHAVGDVWIAAEPGLPRVAVHYDMIETWQMGEGVESVMWMQVELFDINQPITIEPPVMP